MCSHSGFPGRIVIVSMGTMELAEADLFGNYPDEQA
jgi:hypothetical protein